MGSDEQLAAIAERADDDAFALNLYEDPVATLRGEGYDEFADDVESELTKIDGLLRQILGDDEFRQNIEENPTATLTEWGLPDPAIEPVLALLRAPDDVVERAAADVELHGKRTQVSAAAAAAVLGALAFAQSATAASSEGIRWTGVDQQSQVQPSPRSYGAGPEMIQANPIKWGANPDVAKIGIGNADAFRYNLAAFLRRAR